MGNALSGQMSAGHALLEAAARGERSEVRRILEEASSGDASGSSVRSLVTFKRFVDRTSPLLAAAGE
jgi:hypothetical protein